MSKHRKASRLPKLLHLIRLHEWERTGILGSSETGLMTRQQCRICTITRVSKFFDEGESPPVVKAVSSP